MNPIDDAAGGNFGTAGSDGSACRRVREVLHAYADGELDLVRAIDVERHLGQCEACGRAEQCLLAVRSAVAGGSLYHRAPSGLARRVRAAAREEVGRGPRMRLIPNGIAAAAAVLFLLAP